MISKPLTAVIITVSDRASQGIYEDRSGVELEHILTTYFQGQALTCSIHRIVIPDEAIQLTKTLKEAVNQKTDFIFTTGGTGIGSRDITPDTIRPLLSKEIPGIMEVIRVKYGFQFPAAALSRSIAGVVAKSLVYCLPGSTKAVKEYMEEIFKTLMHCYKVLQDDPVHEKSQN